MNEQTDDGQEDFNSIPSKVVGNVGLDSVESIETVNKYYLDGNRLHELLMERQYKPEIPISNELGSMFIKIVNGIMSRVQYRDYTEDWREVMTHAAYMALLRYTHKYDPIKGAEIREAKNVNRKTSLKPVDEGKTAFNYISWAANVSIFSAVAKLKEKSAKRIETLYNDGLLMDIEEVSEEELSRYSNLIEEEMSIDPLQELAKIRETMAKKDFESARNMAVESFLSKHSNKVRRVKKYIKDNNWDVMPPEKPKNKTCK